MSSALLTRHALDRSTARSVPQGIIELILDYGESQPARDSALKHALSGESFRRLRRHFGREVADAFAAYRSTYVVSADGRIITVAHGRQPLFR